MRVNPVILLLLTLLLVSSVTAEDGATIPASEEDQQLFARVSEIPALVSQGKVTPGQVPNPHWRDDACQACHSGNPDARPVQLQGSNADQLCQYCHAVSFALSDSHPVGVKPEVAMIARMPASYRDVIEQREGNLACVTCHELPAQCLTGRRSEKQGNPSFLRDGPFRIRTDQCYLCHDAKLYKRLNPHEQLTKDGRLRPATCLLCHSEDLDSLRKTKGIEKLDFYGEHDLKNLCTRCHPWVPHPGGAFGISPEEAGQKHLQKPSAEVLQLMQKKAEKSSVTLPLEPETGKIFCATCHDPHERGVLENTRPGKEPGKRLRAEQICIQCHLRRL